MAQSPQDVLDIIISKAQNKSFVLKHPKLKYKAMDLHLISSHQKRTKYKFRYIPK